MRTMVGITRHTLPSRSRKRDSAVTIGGSPLLVDTQIVDTILVVSRVCHLFIFTVHNWWPISLLNVLPYPCHHTQIINTILVVSGIIDTSLMVSGVCHLFIVTVHNWWPISLLNVLLYPCHHTQIIDTSLMVSGIIDTSLMVSGVCHLFIFTVHNWWPISLLNVLPYPCHHTQIIDTSLMVSGIIDTSLMDSGVCHLFIFTVHNWWPISLLNVLPYPCHHTQIIDTSLMVSGIIDTSLMVSGVCHLFIVTVHNWWPISLLNVLPYPCHHIQIINTSLMVSGEPQTRHSGTILGYTFTVQYGASISHDIQTAVLVVLAVPGEPGGSSLPDADHGKGGRVRDHRAQDGCDGAAAQAELVDSRNSVSEGRQESCRGAFITLKILTVVALNILEVILHAARQDLPRRNNLHNHFTRNGSDYVLRNHRLALYEKKLTYICAQLANYLREELNIPGPIKNMRQRLINWLLVQPRFTQSMSTFGGGKTAAYQLAPSSTALYSIDEYIRWREDSGLSTGS
ncbi:hypothetical protein J6590_023903 [Homalodisca vitripennis]|nr:hypothetical protein J6590_023903 [Homalodisca vitripennis]